MSKPIKIAVIRGDSLKEQETGIYERLDSRFEAVAFCGKRNVASLDSINMPIIRLPSSADSFLTKNFYKYTLGQYHHLFGLEQQLKNFL